MLSGGYNRNRILNPTAAVFQFCYIVLIQIFNQNISNNCFCTTTIAITIEYYHVAIRHGSKFENSGVLSSHFLLYFFISSVDWTGQVNVVIIYAYLRTRYIIFSKYKKRQICL
jgi:hypothetical protein